MRFEGNNVQVRKFWSRILPVFIWVIGILCKMILSLEPQCSDGSGVVVWALATPLPIYLAIGHAPPEL